MFCVIFPGFLQGCGQGALSYDVGWWGRHAHYSLCGTSWGVVKWELKLILLVVNSSRNLLSAISHKITVKNQITYFQYIVAQDINYCIDNFGHFGF